MIKDDEVHTKVSYMRGNRLQKLAISNKHASIMGTPIINKQDAELITKAMLAMRGIIQKKHKLEHDEGNLKLLPRPMAYKGTAHAWLMNWAGWTSTKTGHPHLYFQTALK